LPDNSEKNIDLLSKNNVFLLKRRCFMKLQKFVSSFFALIFFISCSDESSSNNASADVSAVGETETQLTEQEAKVLMRMRAPNNRVSVEEATGFAEKFINSFDGENALKSGSGRRVSSVSALASGSKPALKSGGFAIPDTLAYVLNFNDSLGFAIVSADTRIDHPVLAFSESGSLMDSTDNPGMAVFFDKLEYYMLNSIAEAEQQKDSLLDGIIAKLGKETDTKDIIAPELILATPGVLVYGYSYGATLSKIGPLMPVEWGQGAPYNDSLPNCPPGTGSDGKAHTGCVATAMAQIMAYWRHPAGINWNELRQYTADPNRKNRYDSLAKKSIAAIPTALKSELANLFLNISLSVKTIYGCASSGATMENAVYILKYLGFGVLQLANPYQVIAFVDAKSPLLVSGCSAFVCHAWVMDGHLRRAMTWDVLFRGAMSTLDTYADYMHNNWGWDGRDNGYFLAGILNATVAADTTNTIFMPSNTKSTEVRDFQYNVRAWAVAR
jgi:hypothetical protein